MLLLVIIQKLKGHIPMPDGFLFITVPETIFVLPKLESVDAL